MQVIQNWRETHTWPCQSQTLSPPESRLPDSFWLPSENKDEQKRMESKHVIKSTQQLSFLSVGLNNFPVTTQTWSYQVSVDEAVGFQVRHALADIQTDTKQAPLVKAAPPLPEVVQQAALLHELSDNVDWPLLAAHPIQLHQFGVGQSPG